MLPSRARNSQTFSSARVNSISNHSACRNCRHAIDLISQPFRDHASPVKGSVTTWWLGGGGGRRPFEVDSFHAAPIGIMLKMYHIGGGDTSPASRWRSPCRQWRGKSINLNPLGCKLINLRLTEEEGCYENDLLKMTSCRQTNTILKLYVPNIKTRKLVFHFLYVYDFKISVTFCDLALTLSVLSTGSMLL